jgi:hypothetical protein
LKLMLSVATRWLRKSRLSRALKTVLYMRGLDPTRQRHFYGTEVRAIEKAPMIHWLSENRVGLRLFDSYDPPSFNPRKV